MPGRLKSSDAHAPPVAQEDAAAVVDAKALSQELEARCTLLLAAVASRRWQMNAQIELAMRAAVVCKQHSSLAQKV